MFRDLQEDVLSKTEIINCVKLEFQLHFDSQAHCFYLSSYIFIYSVYFWLISKMLLFFSFLFL